MKFANPHYFLNLFILLGLIVLSLWAFRRRRAALKKFCQLSLLNDLVPPKTFARQKLKAGIFSLGVIFALLALMRPQWGFHWEELKRKGLDIIIALDTSKSMLSTDVRPNRLARSKLAIEDFARNLSEDRIGLVAFAGSAFLQCPLTVDYGGFLLTVKDVDTDTIPRGGTSLSSAIYEAIKSYPPGQKKHKVLILITDGEDHEGRALEAAAEAKKEGIIIFCIGIGSPEGEIIPISGQENMSGYLKDREGNVVKTKLDEPLLEKIALTCGGSYARAGATEFGLELLYQKKIAVMEKHQLQSRMVRQYEERFQWPLAIALLLILAEILIKDN